MTERVSDPPSKEFVADADNSPRGPIAPPNRRARSFAVALMAVTAAVAVILAASVRHQALYSLSDEAPVELGTLVDGDVTQHAQRYVRAQVELAEPSAKFQRPLEPSSYRVAKDNASGHWVVYGVPDGFPEQRFVPPRLVAGRLSRASELGVRFEGVASTTGDDAWVLVEGSSPQGSLWMVGLLGMLLAFAAFSLGGIARVLRPVR